jgi:transposase-like protein
LRIEATCVKVRAAGRIVARAVSVATGVDADGRGEVPGTDIGSSKVGSFRTAFLRRLARRGLRGAGLCVSDAHESIGS